MAFEEKDQAGSLFKNDRKARDNQPDYTGKAIVNGQPVYVSAWLKDKANGGKFLSLAFKNREPGAFEKRDETKAPPTQDDDLVF